MLLFVMKTASCYFNSSLKILNSSGNRNYIHCTYIYTENLFCFVPLEHIYKLMIELLRIKTGQRVNAGLDLEIMVSI